MEVATDLIDMGLGVGDSLFHDVEIWGSGTDIGQSTSNASNDNAHDVHGNNNNGNQTIVRRRRDNDGDDGDDGWLPEASRGGAGPRRSDDG